jgi:hypothetical protein
MARHAIAGAVLLLATGCGDDASEGTGGGGGGSTTAAASTSGTSTTGATTAPSATSAGGDAGGSGTGGDPGAGGSGTGGDASGGSSTGGAGAGGLTPWEAPIERCDRATDEDDDGLVDEDCAPSLWSRVFVPAGTGLADPTVLDAIEADAGVTLPVIQTYRSTSEAGSANAAADLAAIWARGSTPHLNVEPSGYTPAQYATAASDAQLIADVGAMATAVADALADHPGRGVLLTFAAEMNGDWVDWGCLSPAAFVSFYRWAHGVFSDALDAAAIDRRRVRWVFGPNNVSSDGCGTAAAYYPGHGYTDYLGMSSYRSGTQSVASAVVDPAHALLDGVEMPQDWRGDRFIVLQTGTRDEAGDDRDAWIRDLFATLEADPIFRGAIYFDAADWSVADGAEGGVIEHEGYQGLIDAIAGAPLADTRLEATFDPYFWDVGFGHASYPEIQTIRAAGVAAGCGIDPPRYCPDAALTRADAAVFLARAFGIQPDPPASEATFEDVPTDHPAYGFIEAMTSLEVLGACDDGAFCPTDPIARIDLAHALVRLVGVEAGPSGEPPFSDVGATGEDGAVQLLAEVGHLDGCDEGTFCPDDPTLRDAAARWIVRTAALPAAEPQ